MRFVGGPRVEKHDRSGGAGCLVEKSGFELPVPGEMSEIAGA